MTGRRLLGTLALFGTASVLAPSMAAAQSLRFSDTLHGGIVVTGNALGLSKAIDANGPGIADSIGTFMSLSPTDVDDTPANASNPWFAGTTGNWTANGSEAMLSLPGAAVVERAELVWGGSYSYVEDVSDHLDDAVTLRSAFEDTSTCATSLELRTKSWSQKLNMGWEGSVRLRLVRKRIEASASST